MTIDADKLMRRTHIYQLRAGVADRGLHIAGISKHVFSKGRVERFCLRLVVALFDLVLLIRSIGKIAAVQDGNIVVAKHFEREVSSRRATQVERILAVVVDNDVGVVVDPKITDELCYLCGGRQLSRHLLDIVLQPPFR